jgi:hypothetical protein
MINSDRRGHSTCLPLNDWINFVGVVIVLSVDKPRDLLETVLGFERRLQWVT